MAIIHRIQPKYRNRKEEIVADLLYGTSGVTENEMEAVIKRKTAEISIAMAVLHGGDWRVQIDHEEGFVHITRRLQCSPK
ncbi:hypothetical protein EDE05_12840 [Neorhizobium sp. R1-B]|uniref:hypothetical protein n=1 Tax=Neorhizobium sp. R1-B TaxID=2485162 RepID=UPI001064E3D3|nr:hypothetical protein [Neorhizobium sp. R1-B]TDX72619.1 hypothetical protein EDE05_12840 [Neorhizobium sp. R1-B]